MTFLVIYSQNFGFLGRQDWGLWVKRFTLYFSNDEIAFTNYKEFEQKRVCCFFFYTFFFSSLSGDGWVDVWEMNADGEKWSEVDGGVVMRNWDDLKWNVGGLN